jgi:hypothetical protein
MFDLLLLYVLAILPYARCLGRSIKVAPERGQKPSVDLIVVRENTECLVSILLCVYDCLDVTFISVRQARNANEW